MGLLNRVNPLQGTGSRFNFSTGNTYPAVGTPRGMTYWTPQTSDSNFMFDRLGPKLAGFRATHSPSPWMGDYGHFDVMPVLGPVAPTPEARAAAYRLDHAAASPHRYEATLIRDQIRTELTASERCGVMRFEFPADADDQAAIAIQVGQSDGGGVSGIKADPATCTLSGVSRANRGGVQPNFGCYFYGRLEGVQCVEAGTLTIDEVHPAQHSVQHKRAGAYFRFRPTGPVTLRIATSFIDEDQARLNFHREVADRTFEAVEQRTADYWRQWLARLDCPIDDVIQQRKFYTALYRVALFPMRMHEPDEKGAPRHYSPYDGHVHAGVLYTNNGFWDTYRTVYPLLGMIDPEGFGEIVEGFLNAYREGGWLPKWPSPGYRDCMIGTHADAVIAEAVAQEIPGFDVEEAYEAIRRHAFEPGDPGGRWGRIGLEPYIERGYVAEEDAPYSVCRTLDFAYCDWCIAQVAAEVGRHEDEAALLKRSQNYRHLWHAESGFMRPRRADGSWVTPWTQFDWGGAYIEGGPWQHSWTVPHDLDGLAKLAGGREALADKLQMMFRVPPRFRIGHYGFEIHEMTEMARAIDAEGRDFGQYAHSNQPSHNVIWTLVALGRTDFARHQLHRVMTSLYSLDDFPGDEDTGEMSAWFILSLLGQYRFAPGSREWLRLDGACSPTSVRRPASARVL